MKMRELIQKVSEVYREERGEVCDLITELRQVDSELYDADYNDGKNTTIAKYNELNRKREWLKRKINNKEQYCEGISCVREILMDLGFDTEIK